MRGRRVTMTPRVWPISAVEQSQAQPVDKRIFGVLPNYRTVDASASLYGNGASVGLSNLYYPADARNLTDNVQKLGLQIGTDAISQILKQLWPDWKRKLSEKTS
jgi:hypothetical protein